MAKKLIGGSGSGRFSGKHPSERHQDLPEDVIPEVPEEAAEPEASQPAAPEVPAQPTREEISIPAQELSAEEELFQEEREQTKEQELNLEDAPEESEPRRRRKEKKEKKSKEKKKGSGLKALAWILAVLLFLECAYCVVIFTDWIPPISKLRGIYIETAMSTMRHQWLAKALIPGDVVQKVIDNINKAKEEQVGVNSSWGDVTEPSTEPVETKSPSSGFSTNAAAEILSQLAQDMGMNSGERDFFELFHELDEATTLAYVEEHPEVIAEGWENFLVNEAGLRDDGTSIRTKQGDQVLAVDAANGLMVIRVKGSTYRGVLVIGKDPSRLMCANSQYMGSRGQRAGLIAQNNNGLVAITASGFGDAPNVAEGADLAGGAMSNGVPRGVHYKWGYKRVELHRDNRLYITDAHTGYSKNCTDASEWTPALIVDGKIVVTDADGYTSLNPRACLGQTKDEAILMLGIEGRLANSLGCDANECAEILARYNAYQAMNVDGGTSAIVWYQGEYIMRCSNEALPEGRQLPNAWVYCKDTVPDPE